MRHHYIPEFLQKPWAENTHDGMLEVFRLDLDELISNRHPTKSIGHEADLYALSKDVVAGMEKQAVEKQFLQHVDNYGARVRDKLLENHKLNHEDRNDWTRFLMSLRLRQPSIVQMLKIDADAHLRATLADRPEIYKELAGLEDPLTLEAWSEKNFPGLIENFGLSFFQELIDNPNIGNKILRTKWWTLDFSGVSFDLLLSDNPCIFTAGIDDPNCILALPIAPKKAFMATNSENTAKLMKLQNPRDLAMRINEESLNQTQARIYARDKSPERFLRNRPWKR